MLKTIDSLNIPEKYKIEINQYIDVLRAETNYLKLIQNVYLFGSCAKENVNSSSDIDLAIVLKDAVISKDTFEEIEEHLMYDLLDTLDPHIRYDILVLKRDVYIKNLYNRFSVVYDIARDGININLD